jgi:hypothetical protein
MTDQKSIADIVQAEIARAYFVTAWADQQDADPNGMNLSGIEITEVAPEETDPEALEAAAVLATALCQCNGVANLEELFERAEDVPKNGFADRALTPELFGWYLGMEGMGHGVGLDSFGIDSVDGGIVRTGEVLKVVGNTETIAVPYLESITL